MTTKKYQFFQKLIVCILLLGCILTSFSGCGLFDNSDEEWVNLLSDNGMQANVTIYTKSYSITTSFFGNSERSKTFFGSGVIICKKNGIEENEHNYYVLTNNHVIYKNDGYDNRKITVQDFKGEMYDANLIAYDANYDLALICFSVFTSADVTTSFTPLPIAAQNSSKNTRIASIGQPHGQFNCLTLGKIIDYREPIALTDANSDNAIAVDRSNVQFDIMCHTAPIATGSSGGAVLNQALEIVGINYSSANNKQNSNFIFGLAIPAKKIVEFLTNNSFSLT